MINAGFFFFYHLLLGRSLPWHKHFWKRKIFMQWSPAMENSEVIKWPSGLTETEWKQPVPSTGCNTCCNTVPSDEYRLTPWFRVSINIMQSREFTHKPPGATYKLSLNAAGWNWWRNSPLILKNFIWQSAESLTTIFCSSRPMCKGQLPFCLQPEITGTRKWDTRVQSRAWYISTKRVTEATAMMSQWSAAIS